MSNILSSWISRSERCWIQFRLYYNGATKVSETLVSYSLSQPDKYKQLHQKGFKYAQILLEDSSASAAQRHVWLLQSRWQSRLRSPEGRMHRESPHRESQTTRRLWLVIQLWSADKAPGAKWWMYSKHSLNGKNVESEPQGHVSHFCSAATVAEVRGTSNGYWLIFLEELHWDISSAAWL